MAEIVKNCLHCGRQVILDSQDDNCYFCGKPAFRKEENSMSGVDIEDLDEDTLAKVGEPIPPKPDTKGMSVRDAGKALHEYYEANKDAIISDFYTLGQPAMLKKWGISHSGWKRTGSRWNILEVKATQGKSRASAKDRSDGHKPVSKLPASDKLLSRAQLEVEVAYLRGFRDATLEFLRSNAGRTND